MLDIKFIRENADIVKAGAAKKMIDVDIDALLTLDEKRLVLLKESETLRAEQNAMSEKIASEKNADTRAQMIAEMKGVKEEFQKKEDDLREVMQKWQEIMVRVPNVPDITVPDGASDEENQEI